MSRTVETIVVAHDGSAGADDAFAFALGLAQQLDARIVAVRAWSPLDDLGKHPDHADFHELREEAVAELRDQWCGEAVRAGVDVDARVVEDLPVPGIVGVARDVGADLVVCGTRGRGRVKETVLGSVARELAAHSHLPVTVVPTR